MRSVPGAAAIAALAVPVAAFFAAVAASMLKVLCPLCSGSYSDHYCG